MAVMRKPHFFAGAGLPATLLGAFLLAAASLAVAAPPADGELLSREPCATFPPDYAMYRSRALQQWQSDAAAATKAGLTLRPAADLEAALWSPEDYATRTAYAGFTCERLTYGSGGLRVVAFLWRPADAAGKRLPLIVFNRGGLGETYKLRPNTSFGFYSFVSAGFAVLGTQYRGNDGSEGKESPGAGDIDDVLNLFPLARSLGVLDLERTYMLGFSRGGYVTMRALQRGAKVRAAAVMGAPRSLVTAAPAAPAVTAGVPVPLLVLHGGADGLVPPTEAFEIARLQWAVGQPVEAVIYAGDGHGLAFNGRQSQARIIDWFRRH